MLAFGLPGNEWLTKQWSRRGETQSGFDVLQPRGSLLSLGVKMKPGAMKYLVLSEVAFCFALPATFLFWGVLSFPIWLLGAASTGAIFALIHALCIVGGLLGVIGLVRVVRYLLRSQPTRMRWSFVLPLMAAGLLSIWTTMTGQFTGFGLSWFSVLSTIAPTLCTTHLLWLALRKSRNESPNKPMQATCEDARA